MNTAAKGIIVAFLGLITAIVTNLDRIGDTWKLLVGPKGGLHMDGQWIGVYRDVSEKLDRERIISESVELYQRGTSVTGRASTASHGTRGWEITGKVHAEWADQGKGPFLVLNYIAPNGDDVKADQRRASVGSYVLKIVDAPHPGVTDFEGFWLGHEPDLKRVMVCPYVLSNDGSEEAVTERHKSWLNQRCAYRTDDSPGSSPL